LRSHGHWGPPWLQGLPYAGVRIEAEQYCTSREIVWGKMG
jgi:hypothetical protein